MMPTVESIVQGWHDSFAVHRVYGDPIEKEDLTIIPVAAVAGGGGGGSGPAGETGSTEGSGGGFGGMARPAGVYVVRADRVEWKPALDVTKLALAGMALTALITLTVGKVIRRRR